MNDLQKTNFISTFNTMFLNEQEALNRVCKKIDLYTEILERLKESIAQRYSTYSPKEHSFKHVITREGVIQKTAGLCNDLMNWLLQKEDLQQTIKLDDLIASMDSMFAEIANKGFRKYGKIGFLHTKLMHLAKVGQELKIQLETMNISNEDKIFYLNSINRIINLAKFGFDPFPFNSLSCDLMAHIAEKIDNIDDFIAFLKTNKQNHELLSNKGILKTIINNICKKGDFTNNQQIKLSNFFRRYGVFVEVLKIKNSIGSETINLIISLCPNLLHLKIIDSFKEFKASNLISFESKIPLDHAEIMYIGKITSLKTLCISTCANGQSLIELQNLPLETLNLKGTIYPLFRLKASDAFKFAQKMPLKNLVLHHLEGLKDEHLQVLENKQLENVSLFSQPFIKGEFLLPYKSLKSLKIKDCKNFDRNNISHMKIEEINIS